MLTHKGKFYGDLTIACLKDDDFMIYGSGAAQKMHRRWFESHLDGYDVQYANESRRYHGIGLSGPNMRLKRLESSPDFTDLYQILIETIRK